MVGSFGGLMLAPPTCRWIRLGLVLLFLCWFLQFYRDGFGFTAVLMFDERAANSRVERLRGIPVFVNAAGYDGMYYAQLAADPLLRDPSIDTALDSAPFRARRILFSWTAWVLGCGRPAWALHAYSVQNVLFWLMLAWWLHRRLPESEPRHLAVWTACLFTPGLLDSTRLALLDGPSLLAIALGVATIERGRYWLGSAMFGVAGLGRETNLLAGATLVPQELTWRNVFRLLGGLVLLVLPSLLWFDYLRSIYRSTATDSMSQLWTPVVAFVDAWSRALDVVDHSGWALNEPLHALALAGITVQAGYLLVASRHRWRAPWWRVGVAFAALMLVIKPEIWLGAYLRVLLPLTLAFNLLLPGGRAFWPIFAAGNLGLATSVFLVAGAF